MKDRWKAVAPKPIRRANSGGDDYCLVEVHVLKLSQKAVKVRSARPPRREGWVPLSCLHVSSEKVLEEYELASKSVILQIREWKVDGLGL